MSRGKIRNFQRPEFWMTPISDFAVECRRAQVLKQSGGKGDTKATARGGGGILGENDACCSRTYSATRSPSRMTISHVNACMLAVMRFHCESTSALW